MRSVLLDTNLFVLLIVGLYDKDLIGKHKRTQTFVVEDFDLLVESIDGYEVLWVTSHCLAEISNLLKQTHGNRARDLMTYFSTFIAKAKESHIPKETIFKNDILVGLGVADTGIREATILGQGIGMAVRGLRPIAEIQYLDYVLYCLQIMSDDLATLHYRTCGKQKAPLIVRTRGHRLEGIWHSGSPMGGLIHLLRGMYILVPRNMTKAAGFYNTLLDSDEPALLIECLNGYRLKEKMPNNLSEIRTPIGVVETLKEGADITLVSYGSTLRIAKEAAKELLQVGIDAEVIDVQTLLPLDINQDMVKSIQKTNRLLVIDEDVPGGASSYILNEIVEHQNGYQYLDSKPQTLTAKQHRPAYGSDGDYFSKPSQEDIFEKVYEIMNEANPNDFPKIR